jgi:hypothetical protein
MTEASDRRRTLEKITDFFIASTPGGSFNGVVFQALLSLLEILEKHPKGHAVDLPDVVRQGRLDPW